MLLPGRRLGLLWERCRSPGWWHLHCRCGEADLALGSQCRVLGSEEWDPLPCSVCCSLEGKNIWVLQNQTYLRVGLEIHWRHSESVFLFEICEQILLLWQRCCCAVITLSSYCHSPVNDSACATETVSSMSVYYLGHHGTHCKHQFWSLPYLTRETFSGQSLDCRVIKEPVNLLSPSRNSSHLGIAAGTVGLHPQSPSANLAFEKLFLDS